METPDLVIGLLGIVLGAALIAFRERLAARQRRRTPEGIGSIPAPGWAAAGVLFLVTGALKIISGVS